MALLFFSFKDDLSSKLLGKNIDHLIIILKRLYSFCRQFIVNERNMNNILNFKIVSTSANLDINIYDKLYRRAIGRYNID